MRKILLTLAFLVSLTAVSWRISYLNSLPVHLPLSATSAEAQTTPTTGSGSGSGVCAAVGNNSAVPFPGGIFNEGARHTLGLVTNMGDVPAVVSSINGSDGTVIVRLGAGKDSENLTSAQYVDLLRAIASQTDKPFVATAGHNEPNCAEWRADRGFDYEVRFTTEVAAAIQSDSKLAGQITLITGQIDHYCGVTNDRSKEDYITTLANIPGIQGLALPFYITDGTPDAASTVSYFQGFANMTGKDIYITEAGPLKSNSFEEFAKAVPMLLQSPVGGKIKGLLLFNAFFLNGEFAYAKPFQNPACREAFRTKCTDPEEVIRICGQDVVNPDDFYLYYIKGIKEGLPNDITSDLIDQGYEVSCTTPTFHAEGVRTGAWEIYQSQYGPGSYSFPSLINSTQIFDYTNAQIPVLRDKDAGQPDALKNSLEDYFGFQDTVTKDELQSLIGSSPIYSLLDREAQCQQKVKLLETTQKMCDQLQDPNTCALYQPIPNAPAYTTKTIWEAYRSSGLSCADIAANKYSATQATMANALMNTPLYLDKAYRLAFLVVVTDAMRPNLNPNVFFNFFTQLSPNPDPNSATKFEIRVIAFKIPDFGTNRDFKSEIYYEDPSQLTRNALLPLEYIEQSREEEIEKRAAMKTKIPAANEIKVGCQGGGQPQSEACKDPLTLGLIDLINKSPVGSCIVSETEAEEELKYEPANTIMDAARISTIGDAGAPTNTPAPGSSPAPAAGAGRIFKDGFDIVKNLIKFPSDQNLNPEKATFNFMSMLDPAVKDDGAPTDFVGYLVYPMGYEQEFVEDTLVGFLNERGTIVDFDEDPAIAKYFRIEDVQQGLTANEVKTNFIDRNAPPPCPNPPPGVPLSQPCTQEVGVKVEAEQSDNAPRILGARLGQIAILIQQDILPALSDPHAYVTNCQTTEDYLLGRCGRRPIGGENDPSVPDDENVAVGACNTALNGPCSVANLERYFTESNGVSARQKATIASAICMRESGGNKLAENSSCRFGTDGIDNDGDGKTDAADSWVRNQTAGGIVYYSFDGGTLDYSIGLFQINLLAHCNEAGATYSSRPAPLQCSIANSSAADQCRQRLQTPEGNIEAMVRISENGTNWGPWGGAPRC